MAENGRFCVQFSGTDLQSLTKTRILYKESKPSDVRDIWKMVYNSDPPDDIHLIIANHATYDLNDENDFSVVMAIAEDQYRAHPSNPLHITLSIPRVYKPNTPPSSNPSPEQPTTTSVDSSKDIQEGQKSSPSDYELQIDSDSQDEIIEESVHKPDADPRADESSVVQDLSMKKKVICNRPKVQTFVQNVFNTHMETPDFSGKKKVFNKYSEDHSIHHDSRQAYSQMRENQEFQSRIFNHNNDKALALPTGTKHLPTSQVSAASALVNSVQQQRLLQNNPNAPFILQSIRNNYERYAAMNWLKHLSQPAPNSSNGFSENSMDFKYFGDRDNYAAANSIPALAMQRNKRKSNIVELDGKKERCSGKRMRSSSSQSNIEFHCEQAEKYMNLPAVLKKEHNSAHRSHWKHLSHVLSIWPQFATLYKHKKYDEWSSEARDIYAISLPEEYKWSFLTLAKQGDQLCRRIKGRVEEMRRLPLDQRPEWCPPDETLQMTWVKADERLQQLERIRNARHSVSTNPPASTSKPHQAAPPDHFAISTQQPTPLISQASTFSRDVFGECSFNLLDQQSKLNGRLNSMAANQSYASPVRSIMPADAFSADVPSVLNHSLKHEVLDGGINFGLSPTDKSNFFFNRMKLLAANFQDGVPSTSNKEEPNQVSFPTTKSVAAQPNATPVSPLSPRHIG